MKEHDGDGKKNYPGKLGESSVFLTPVRNPNRPAKKLAPGLFMVAVEDQIMVPVVFDYTDFKPDYTNQDAWWYYDIEENKVHVQIEDRVRRDYVLLLEKQTENTLTDQEERDLTSYEVIISTTQSTGAEFAVRRYYSYLIYSKIKHENITEQENSEPEKKEYRTKKGAGAVMSNLPANLAIITNDQYKGGLGLSQTGGAYLYPLATTDGLTFDGKNLFFKGLPTSEATLKEINKDKEVSLDDVDLPLLRMFYSIILSDFEANSKKLGVVNETTTVYVPDLAAMLGKGRNISKNDINAIIDKTSSFQTIYGVLKDPKRPNGIGTAVPLLVWLGYDEATNTIKFASPYMTDLIKRIYNVSIRKDKKGEPKLKKNGEPQRLPSHSYLVKSEIVKERNKRAVEIVIVVVTMIEQAGNHVPHIMAGTILERVPQLQNAISKTKNISDKNRMLKRAFTKAWELLDTHTTLKEKYPTIVLPDPKNPKNIPTMATLDMVFEFPHLPKYPTQEP